MKAETVLERLRASSPDPFFHYIVGVNGEYRDFGGELVRIYYDYDILGIEFTGSLKDKFKPTLTLWNNDEVTVVIKVDKIGVFCFPVTGRDEYLRERLSANPHFRKMESDESMVQEFLNICYWIVDACAS